jgi:putative copper export protein
MPPSCDCQTMPVPWALVAVRAVHYSTCLLLFGVAGFDRLVASPVARRNRSAAPAGPLDSLRLSRRGGWAILALLILTLASGAAWLVLVAGEMAEMTPLQAWQEGAVGIVWHQTRIGGAWQFRTACLAAAFAAAALLAGVRPPSRWRGAAAWLLLVSTGGMTAGLAWAGHGLTGEGTTGTCHAIADVLHLLVSGLWPMGLLPFAIVLRRLRGSALSGASALTAAVVRRFSALSLFSVAALTLTGFVNSWALVGSVGALFNTRYGQTLAVKLGLFIVIVGFGAVNLLVLKPRVSRDSGDRQGAPLRWLQFNITGELFLGTLIVLVVALLGMLAPAAE